MKQTIENGLRRLRELERQIQWDRERLRCLRLSMIDPPASAPRERVKTSYSPDPALPGQLDRVDEIKERLCRSLQEAAACRNSLLSGIGEATDSPQERMFLRLRLVEGRRIKDIALHMGLSERQLYRLQKKARARLQAAAGEEP